MLRFFSLASAASLALVACGNSNGSQPGDPGPSSSGTDSGTAAGDSGSSAGGGDGGGAAPDGGSASDAGGGASVLQFHSHINRDGFTVDGKITEAAAAGFHRDATFAGKVQGNVYASPLYVENGPGGKGTFYVATENATVYALDEGTGAVTWSKNLGKSATSTGAGCGNIGPIGITGTPAIDLATRMIIFDAASADAKSNILTHTIYALSIDDGTQKWKVDVSTLSDSTGVAFSPQPQNQRGAVLIVNATAYVVFGGHYGDCGNYRGWVVSVPLSGTGAKAWATSVQGAGIWAPGGAASDGQSIYVSTGNGFGAANTWSQSEGILRLAPGPTFSGAAADYFAPYNWQALDNGDVDLSGSGPLVIDAPSLVPSKVIMAQGKDGYLYLIDRANLGGVATQAKLANVGALHVQNGEITNGGAWANIGATTYVVVRPNGTDAAIGCPNGTSGDLVAVKLDAAAAEKMSVAWCASSNGTGSPSITTSDGKADPLVWAFGAEGSGKLYAWDLPTGKQVFAGGAAADVSSNVRRFTTPIAVHGRILVGGDNQLYAYKGK